MKKMMKREIETEKLSSRPESMRAIQWVGLRAMVVRYKTTVQNSI